MRAELCTSLRAISVALCNSVQAVARLRSCSASRTERLSKALWCGPGCGAPIGPDAAAQVLSGLNHSDLNYVLVHINTAALFEVAGRHTMELLTSPQQRLPDLTTLTR